MFKHNSKTVKGEPKWSTVDKSKLPRLAFARKGEADKKSTWGFPHHWVQNGGKLDENGIYTTGTLYLHRGGLNAAWSAANGGRSGKPAEPAVLAHLRKHFKDLGIPKSELARLFPDVDLDAVDQELLKQGLLQPDDLEPTITDLVHAILTQ